jgi:hypothetical protein
MLNHVAEHGKRNNVERLFKGEAGLGILFTINISVIIIELLKIYF